jgi:hypothetical protein
MKEKSKVKGLSEWKLIPDRNTGAIYTPLRNENLITLASAK